MMSIDDLDMTKGNRLLDRELSDYDDAAASDVPFPLRVLKADGSEDGLILQVLGGESDRVQKAVNELVNDRRKRQANALAVNKGASPDFTPVEDDIAFGRRLTAARVVGWNLKTPFSPDDAFRLVSRSARIAEQITTASNDIGNFTPKSPEI